MLPEQYQWVVAQFEPEGDPWLLLDIARTLEGEDNLEGAATVLDRAYGIAPELPEVRQRRASVLAQLAVVEHGLCFRYVPGGPFLMGCAQGEADEAPWHPVWLSPYWLAEAPLSWAAYCRLMDWEAPPVGFPRDGEVSGGDDPRMAQFYVSNANKIRLQYCEDRTTRARDWHSHAPGQQWRSPGGQTQTAQELFGAPPRDDPNAAWQYDTKPMIAVSWNEAQHLTERLCTPEVRYVLPTEAQWEKAARGGLIGARHAWGNDPPIPERCDCDRFLQFSILPSKTFAPNGYGLYALNGGVWEWTRDWYDGEYYRDSPDSDPEGPPDGHEKVLRGGSWSDCPEVVTVTFRMSQALGDWRDPYERRGRTTPTIGFRLCRTVVGQKG
jgi:formylglycine-generating enzyme required for sulfatase activity